MKGSSPTSATHIFLCNNFKPLDTHSGPEVESLKELLVTEATGPDDHLELLGV